MLAATGSDLMVTRLERSSNGGAANEKTNGAFKANEIKIESEAFASTHASGFKWEQKRGPTCDEDPESEPDLDSGYAWLILLVMFLLNSTISGSSRVYGIVYAKQVALGYYDREEASWPIATASAVENLAGILTPALAVRLSWRQIELLSSVLFIVANLGAYLSDSLALDILCLGVIQGIALSMSTVLSLAINNDYFRRYRTTAYGISLSGSTFGVLYLAPIVAWILEASDDNFRLVYLTLAIVFLANVFLVLLIRPRSRVARSQQPDAVTAAPVTTKMTLDGNQTSKDSRRKISRLEQHLERKTSVASRSVEFNTRRHNSWRKENSIATPKSASVRETSWRKAQKRSTTSSSGFSVSSMTSAASEKAKATTQRISLISAVTNSSAHKSPARVICTCDDPEVGGACVAQDTRCKTISTEADANNERAQSDGQTELESGAGEGQISLAFVLKFLRVPYLHCVWIMLALYYLISRVLIIILVDFASDHGIHFDESRQLLNYWSLGEVCGRILLGSFIDLNWLSCKNCIFLTCSSLAICLSLMVACESYYVYAACSALIAALASLEYMLINVLMIEYIGQHQVTSCYSLAAFISSLVLFGRPTMIGFFRDHLGSYDGLLALLAAVTLAFAVIFQLLEPLVVRRWPKGGS